MGQDLDHACGVRRCYFWWRICVGMWQLVIGTKVRKRLRRCGLITYMDGVQAPEVLPASGRDCMYCCGLLCRLFLLAGISQQPANFRYGWPRENLALGSERF